jgi:hypothetical protein
VSDRFRDFWGEYPWKIEEDDAKKVYAEVVPDQETHDKVMHRLALDKEGMFREHNGRYIAKPAKWLRQRRWAKESAEEKAEQRRADLSRQQAEQRRREEAERKARPPEDEAERKAALAKLRARVKGTSTVGTEDPPPQTTQGKTP